MAIRYERGKITALQFADVLRRSGLGAVRPVDDLNRLQRMLDEANLVLTARTENEELVGIARSLTDWSFACYLSELAVDAEFQGLGIGKRLIELTREHAGEECMCLLVAAPNAVSYYERIAMPRTENAFLYPRSR